jgi:GNAT superfamily N-acetyltransferase
MTDNGIRFDHIKVVELEDFAKNLIDKAQPGQFVPITLQRARAHANNPYADPDDVALLAAIDEEDDVVGYFGIMPMRLRVGEHLYKTHWFTTWSVSPKVRGRGVGFELMREALTLKLDFLIVGSVHARRVCEKFGFWEREPLQYYWIDPSGMGKLNPLTWVLRFLRKSVHLLKIDKEVRVVNAATRKLDASLSPLTRRLFYPLLTWKLKPVLDRSVYKEVSQIRSELPPRLDPPNAELQRGPEALNWMLSHPWVLETGQSPTENLDYYFSDTRPIHSFIALELYDPVGEIYNGFVVFSISQKGNNVALKILDYRVSDVSQYASILALAVHYGKRLNADILEIPDEVAGMLKGSLLGWILLIAKSRIYQCFPKSEESPLAKAWVDLELHLYDGDMAFS